LGVREEREHGLLKGTRRETAGKRTRATLERGVRGYGMEKEKKEKTKTIDLNSLLAQMRI